MLFIFTFSRTKGSKEVCLDLNAEPGDNIAYALELAIFWKIQNDPHHLKGYKSGFPSLLVLKQTIETMFGTAMFANFDPFYERHYEMMSRLADSGLLNRYNDLNTNPRGMKLKIEQIDPQVLTVEHLMIGLRIWLIAVLISLIAFVAEISIKHFEKIKSELEAKIQLKMLEIFKPKLCKHRATLSKIPEVQNNQPIKPNFQKHSKYIHVKSASYCKQN